MLLMCRVALQLVSGTVLRVAIGEVIAIAGLGIVAGPIVMAAGVGLGIIGALHTILGAKDKVKNNQFY